MGCTSLPPAASPCSADVLPQQGSRGGAQGAAGSRARAPCVVEPHGGGTSGRAHADRRVPSRRPCATPVPALDPGRRCSTASRRGEGRSDRGAAPGDQGDEEPNVRSHPGLDPRPAPVAARAGGSRRGDPRVPRRDGARIRRSTPRRYRRGGRAGADRTAAVPQRTRGCDERAQAREGVEHLGRGRAGGRRGRDGPSRRRGRVRRRGAGSGGALRDDDDARARDRRRRNVRDPERSRSEGTTITVRFPTSWLQEEEIQNQAQPQAPALPPAGASRGAVSTPPASPTESIPA